MMNHAHGQGHTPTRRHGRTGEFRRSLPLGVRSHGNQGLFQEVWTICIDPLKG